ncbi:hypothetical protein GUJ93_ZPchr0006g44647 [Zizania palustris]|uniref:Uncharacterized protein n=1 Tax=Zizania palustris TaxID=103762 RepID=A0A8J5SSX2_ZIZPA|nr:hypothetical protein GUJ93_ZPchr0006g44647 [Zizania palustris]
MQPTTELMWTPSGYGGAAPPAAAEPEKTELMWTPSSNGGAAPTAAAEPEPEPELMWTWRHDKLLELLELMDIEVRIAMEAPEVETPSEWDLQETAALSPPMSEQPAPLTGRRHSHADAHDDRCSRCGHTSAYGIRN